MKNSSIMKFVGSIFGIIGVILLGAGAYRRHYAQMFINTSTYVDHTFLVWSQHKQNATYVLIAGIVVVVIGAILLCAGFLKANAAANPETPPTTPKAYTTTPKPSNTSSRLAELKALHDSGVITAEEYEEKRKKIIDEI